MYTNLTPTRLPGVLDRHSLMGGGLGIAFDPVSAAVSAGVGVATVALGSWLADKRATGQQKTYSTTIVNDLEPLLRENARAYLAGPGSCSDQAAALTAFDSAMQWLQSSQACGNLQLGTPGQNCINDRLPGGKWDWTAYYRNPIANDPRPLCVTSADGAEQAAVANIVNKLSGSGVQTNAQSFATGAPPVVNNGGVVTPSATNEVAGVPVSYLLIGGGALLLILLLK